MSGIPSALSKVLSSKDENPLHRRNLNLGTRKRLGIPILQASTSEVYSDLMISLNQKTIGEI